MTLAHGTPRQVVVLAGGLGTRLQGVGETLPKAMRPVGDRPFLDVMLAPLVRGGHRRFHFCLGHLADDVEGHLDRQPPMLEITTTVEQVPRGTAGALIDALDHLDETFLLVMGDTYLDVDYARVLTTLPDDAAAMLLVTSAPCDVAPNVKLERARVSEYRKAGVPGGWTDTGAALIGRSALAELGCPAMPMDLGILFERLIAQRRLAAETTDERFVDIGTPDRYHDFQRQLRREGHRQGVAL
jgi:NDP-sugar pyrophosphorylase family protein